MTIRFEEIIDRNGVKTNKFKILLVVNGLDKNIGIINHQVNVNRLKRLLK